MGELVGLGLSGLLWVGIARALTSSATDDRRARIAGIALSIPCLLFALMAFVATTPPPEALGMQLLSVLVWWAIIGRPTPAEPDDDDADQEDEKPFLPVVARCSSCAGELAEGARFCEACGTKVARERTCKRCGETSRPGAKFCKGCGGSFKPGIRRAEAAPAGAKPGDD